MFEKPLPPKYKHYHSIDHRATMANIDMLTDALDEVRTQLAALAAERTQVKIKETKAPKAAD